MRGFWKFGGGFIKEVMELLPAPRPPYTTLASTVRNLERKGYLSSRKLGNTYRFVPSVTAEEYRRQHLGALVTDYFRGSYKELVLFLAQEQKISSEELQDVIDMTDSRRLRL